MGERSESAKPHYRTHNYGRDWCNLYYLHATMLGMTSISINITHGMAATDFVSALQYVDADRLGVMGAEWRRHDDVMVRTVRRPFQGG